MALKRRAAVVAAGTAAAYAATLAVNRSLRAVTGRSMAPTLEDGERLVVLPGRLRRPRRGDIVVVRDPRQPDRATVKRVVALPGELVEVRHGRLHVDGVPQMEPYAAGQVGEDRCTVPEGHLYVLGDNRGASTDSRAYGPVPADLVDATVVARVRPARVGLRQPPRPLSTAG